MVLNGFKNRGISDILIACVDGLTGFTGAIGAVFPQTEIQQCVIRNSTKSVSYKDIKALMAGLKIVDFL
jgi:transposase-like protein